MTISPPSTGSPRQQRREAVAALVENGWARVDVPRPAARPHVVLMVAALAAAAALGTGVVLQLVRPVPLPGTDRPAAPPAVAAFTAVSGWDCATAADRGFDVQGRTAQWYTVARGGWTGDGCHGTFEAVPTSGDPATEGPQRAVWWFAPGTAYTRCAVEVFRPAPARARDAAIRAARYYVRAGRDGARLAAFDLDQTAGPGTWAAAGTFPVSAGGVAVELVDRGVAPAAGDRLAVTQVRVRCTG
ncbi:hypothetical protein [Plantactinospora sp. KBS50]|uniref:hypothetical protein n=1 Tax=Plantactinospora sp. KBS50 TaxID=2024580 RepID=UPI000BAAEC9C|nr:hypothetical protein [Plantactinospora sp. KBS50]ASW55404.1 hypothetical protein CIK06_16365 [Plantactinospora sp. KBS50]